MRFKKKFNKGKSESPEDRKSGRPEVWKVQKIKLPAQIPAYEQKWGSPEDSGSLLKLLFNDGEARKQKIPKNLSFGLPDFPSSGLPI